MHSANTPTHTTFHPARPTGPARYLARQADEAAKRDAAGQRQAASDAAALHRQAGELLAALRALARNLLQGVGAMDAASCRLQVRPAGSGGSGAGSGPSQQQQPAPPAPYGADAIAQLTSLSVDEVRDLLHVEAMMTAAAAGAGGVGAGIGAGAAAAATPSLEAAQRVADLLEAIESSLGPPSLGPPSPREGPGAAATTSGGTAEAEGARPLGAAPGSQQQQRDRDPSRDQVALGRGGAPAVMVAAGIDGPRCSASWQHGRGVPAAGGLPRRPWDPRLLHMLVERAQAEERRAEGALQGALQRLGA